MAMPHRRWLFVLVGAALLIGLTTGPLLAAKPVKKTYSVTVNPTSVVFNPAGVEETFTLRYTNTTPGGVSSFNSLTLTAPAGFTIDLESVTVSTSTGVNGFNVATSSSAPNITVTNLYPVAYSEWVELTFDATVLISVASCDGAKGTWVPKAWTGSNTSGTLFELTGDAPTTTVGTHLYGGQATEFVDGVKVTNVGTACAPLSFSRDGNTLSVWKPEDPSLALRIDISAWDPEPADGPVNWTQVDTPGPDHDIKWCIGTWGGGASMDGVAMPEGEVSCLLRQQVDIAGTDESGNPLVQVYEWIYLTGDWIAHR